MKPKQPCALKAATWLKGTPKSLAVTSNEIREALSETVNQIIRAVRLALEQAPPELAGDIADRGIMLTGGGALLHGIDTSWPMQPACPSALPTSL